MAKYVILSDIHGNMPALEAVVADICASMRGDGCSDSGMPGTDDDSLRNGGSVMSGFEGIFLLGDLIDYGIQSNEVVSFVRDELEERVGAPIAVSVWGNHERVCMLGVDFDRLSSERTVASAKYTASVLTEETKAYLRERMQASGMQVCEVDAELAGVEGDQAGEAVGGKSTDGSAGAGYKRILVVHGSVGDPFFGGIFPEDVQGDYRSYDLVLSGHTHFPHVFAKFYPCEDERLRNKKPTVFINPGSVGQPRNRNSMAQYAVWDAVTGQTELRAVPYDIEKAMAMYHGQVDDFYRDRLQWGV